MSREILKEVFIDAPVETVWRAISEADELVRWFPVEARVTPGVGGSVWISWGEGAAGEAPITAWEPERRLQWTETRGPVKIAVDFYLEGRDGGTVVRLVQSGFGDGPEWDGEYHMVDAGWTYFTFHLKWYLEHHRGVARDLIGFRTASALTAADAYARLQHVLDSFGAKCIFERPATAQAAYTIEGLNNAIVFIEIEPGSPQVRAGFWFSTYGLPPGDLAQLRADVTAAYTRAITTEG
jgi:uncharacterized protein YndB with AHSA1/START domain